MNDAPQRPSSRLPRPAARLMIAMLIAFALLAIYANVQRARRAKYETVTVIPASPTPTARPR